MSYKNYSEIDLAAINPIRYRGYYYDEVGFYYLQSRYYMPDWSRFLNSDLPSIAQEHKDEINGLNLFGYCCNDPINNVDYDGYKSSNKRYYIKIRLYGAVSINLFGHVDLAYGGKVRTYGKYNATTKDKKGNEITETANFVVAQEYTKGSSKGYVEYMQTQRTLKTTLFLQLTKGEYDRLKTYYNYFTKPTTSYKRKNSKSYKGERYKIYTGKYATYSATKNNCATMVYDALLYSMYTKFSKYKFTGLKKPSKVIDIVKKVKKEYKI